MYYKHKHAHTHIYFLKKVSEVHIHFQDTFSDTLFLLKLGFTTFSLYLRRKWQKRKQHNTISISSMFLSTSLTTYSTVQACFCLCWTVWRGNRKFYQVCHCLSLRHSQCVFLFFLLFLYIVEDVMKVTDSFCLCQCVYHYSMTSSVLTEPLTCEWSSRLDQPQLLSFVSSPSTNSNAEFKKVI